ncbi:Lrp/AsnC family transcriptional regulator [Cellvibrio polysaccharolyticus]|uniref:Lrp/AsnC family transcriptional regulator n=1 Tax=Cellvibrio polysaccharolyticus TaxID=2082724 RepID=A0A928V4T7_9GAMM|nr:Lrp/AsnC family transcriptional regulator [Cellvibrio polysaccharolyticus]MBE8717215.1 Lrp/AsnC family transcriptional regulator [Cellvibrio polysaccharolyticus]
MTNAVELDEYDRKILRALQENGDYSMADLGNLIGLSHTPCWRRLKRLEAEGIIRGKVTLLDADMLNLGVTVHVYVNLKTHEQPALDEFEAALSDTPEIVECYAMSGDRDYLLRVVVESVAAYEQLLRHSLMRLPHIANISSSFALRQVKYTTRLPL